MRKTAFFDNDHKYRYGLIRTWDEAKPVAAFIMLNPSTADDANDDPTIRRCIRFAQDWGYGGLRVVNLFALISSDPKKLLETQNSIGEGNDDWILFATRYAGIIVSAWGSFKEAKSRAAEVLGILRDKEIYCLGQNKDGSPKHPLYISANTQPSHFKEVTT